ncbi:hypothetical protein D3C85_1067320 [compost metagenome]
MQWNALVPELLVADHPAAKTVYRDLFGFALRFERTEDDYLFRFFQYLGERPARNRTSGEVLARNGSPQVPDVKESCT